jgi:Protein of unknown function (DUF3102)
MRVVQKSHAAESRSVTPVKNAALFNYSGVPSDVANFLKAQVHRIRRQAGMSIIHIGKDLIAAKHYLSHGAFLKWVEIEVGIPARTAQAYMQVAQWASHKSATVALLPPSVLYLLSAPRTPEFYKNDILRRVEAGERIALPAIREELKALRESRPEADLDELQTEREAAAPDERSGPIAAEAEVNAALERAVAILVRALSTEDFVQVRDMLTSRPVLEEPELAMKIAAAFGTRNGEPYGSRRHAAARAENQLGA